MVVIPPLVVRVPDVPAILLVKNGKVEKRFFGNDEDKKFNKNKFLESFYKLD